MTKIIYPFYSTESSGGDVNPLIHKHPESTRSACQNQVKGIRQIIGMIKGRHLTAEICDVLNNSLVLVDDVMDKQKDQNVLNNEFEAMVKREKTG